MTDIARDFRSDVLRRNLMADVVGGIGYPLPQLIDGGRQLCAAALGLMPQLLHGSCHGVTYWTFVRFLLGATRALLNGSSGLRRSPFADRSLSATSYSRSRRADAIGTRSRHFPKSTRALRRGARQIAFATPGAGWSRQ